MATETESTAANVDERAACETIRELIVELAPNEAVREFEESLRLVEDLEYHSLALMELAFTLEDEFSLEPIDEEAALAIVTAGDVEKHVLAELRRLRTA
jgi:acyl carrier protein